MYIRAVLAGGLEPGIPHFNPRTCMSCFCFTALVSAVAAVLQVSARVYNSLR